MCKRSSQCLILITLISQMACLGGLCHFIAFGFWHQSSSSYMYSLLLRAICQPYADQKSQPQFAFVRLCRQPHNIEINCQTRNNLEGSATPHHSQYQPFCYIIFCWILLRQVRCFMPTNTQYQIYVTHYQLSL